MFNEEYRSFTEPVGDVIAEASRSVEHPITISIDKDHYQIGNKEEFLYRRMAI